MSILFFLITEILFIEIVLIKVIFLDEITMTQLELPLSLACRKRRQDHHNISSHQLGFLINVPHRFQVSFNSLQFFKAQLPVSILPPPELQLHTDFVSFIQEGFNSTQLDIIIVLFSAHSEFDLL